MTDYRELTPAEQAKIDTELKAEKVRAIDIAYIHNGDMCAICGMIFYNCLCSHDN
jgi:hypothetical protein